MSELPKLKIKRTWNPVEETHDLEQARQILFDRSGDMLVIVEGQMVSSYEELVQLAGQDTYKDKEALEVVMTPLWPAGG
jgi:hypothetical protein